MRIPKAHTAVVHEPYVAKWDVGAASVDAVVLFLEEPVVFI
jgi:hypothetical protein